MEEFSTTTTLLKRSILPDRLKKILNSEIWDALWVVYWSLVVWLFVYFNKRWLRYFLYKFFLWLKDGWEDADGKHNQKDLWFNINSATIIIMGFLQWKTQIPFPLEFWAIMAVSTGATLFTRTMSYFKKNNDQK
jgi:hypothetical protein